MQSAKRHSFSMKSFSVIEILIVFAIMAILAGIAFTSPSLFSHTFNLEGAAQNGFSLLLEARAKTLSSYEASSYGVHFEQTKITLFKGLAFVSGDPDNKEYLLPQDVEISTIALNGGGQDVIFKRLTGQTDQYGSITFRLVSNPSTMRIITIQMTGAITL